MCVQPPLHINVILLYHSQYLYTACFSDQTPTVSNLVQVMERVKSCRRRELWERALGWYKSVPSYLNEVYTTTITEMEKLTALADVYVNIRPTSSWQHLIKILYADCELRAIKEAKSFLDHYGEFAYIIIIIVVMVKYLSVISFLA